MIGPESRSVFQRIFRYYAGRYKKLFPGLKGPYGITEVGAWAASRPVYVFSFFKKLHLEKASLFIDLGCGDGIVVAVASLFTTAVGIERNFELAHHASLAFKTLGLKKASVICGDFLEQKIELADVLYIYPDKPVFGLFNRLKEKGWEGELWVYGPHLAPPKLLPTNRITLGKDTLTLYDFSNPSFRQ
ncbi:hypothetical protein [Thermodesulforhabdus norvegica]|uniref:Protein-L-isoaspartate(D-aspartate) O-methyltransferase (PCMT) n=1 Tax=Thermodesulforhabdus norvegica TaxID=39841 RepID=A0A1I4SWI3_9BACT|nr:hypothetical protein [Thermodesulforhabdus norvegica]SFM68673.1 Protein-L-isoaspartate(D-aspartate) O-methyltransferase (PCMT) [Thermodesulforhabdus norvegica]